MAGMRTILALAGLLAAGALLVILSCALHGNWLPLVAALLFGLAPAPNALARRVARIQLAAGLVDSTADSSVAATGHFVTACMLISAAALPAVLAHVEAIPLSALLLSVSGGSLIYATVVGYTACFGSSDADDLLY